MKQTIDRETLVSRHNITLTDWGKVIPLGNGEFCFGADRTGLQTFTGNEMSHWAWHSYPLPEGVKGEDLPETGSYMQGRLTGKGEDRFEDNAARAYMFDNPHIADLGRLRFVKEDGSELDPAEITGAEQVCDLWNGILTTEFPWNGKTVAVETVVHPEQDAVSVKIAGASGLALAIDFPYPIIEKNTPWAGDFSEAVDERHTTFLMPHENFCCTARIVDDLTYNAGFCWDRGELTMTGAHGVRIAFENEIELTLRYSAGACENPLPTFAETKAAAAEMWHGFWQSGGAIDLSESEDERWFELERRIVLSQYLLRVQSAGSWPSSEAGLMSVDSWRGQFHMEMVYWHAAHYLMWKRPELADDQLGCYKRFLPMAKKLAAQLGYRGAKWGKSTNPNGRTAPWRGNLALLWKQPHPMTFAELEYKNRPTEETLEKWAEILDETAEHMADYATKGEDGRYHLDPSMPPSELGFTRDTLFDLVYWNWGLELAQTWRQRMGKERVPLWDGIAENLAKLPVKDGLYLRSPEYSETYTKQNYEHPDMVGIYGMIPPTEIVDRRTVRASLKEVWRLWNRNHIWGWDFPWIAMCASRVNEPEIAVDAMLSLDVDEVGASGRGSYPYLPANGGVLYAAAMMAVGGRGEIAPGFPRNGKWNVKAENLLEW